MTRCYLTVFACLLGACLVAPTRAQTDHPFRIDVLDAGTGRGVPLVELSTTNAVRWYTDSNGIAAVTDPELMARTVYFHVKSHGYELAADGFGYRGVSFDVTPGGRGVIKLKRINVAERLYRVTGAGIYSDSVLVGAPVPVNQPLMNGLVTGQDSVFAAPYKGRIFWLWGDTNRPSYPLGNFNTSSATSLPPGRGGLDPGVGVDLTYWVDGDGFSRKMMPMEGALPVWLSALFTVRNADGRELMYAKYAQVSHDMRPVEYGLAHFNDDKAVFEKALATKAALFPDGHPFHATVNGHEYVYFQATGVDEPCPVVRVEALPEHVVNPDRYEGFTCLATGARWDGVNTRLDRKRDGTLVYGWKPGTPPLNHEQRETLVAARKLKAEESPFQLRDIETGATIRAHGGSVFWNPFRGRWVMIAGQAGGTSYLGEVWFAEADTPAGPWVYARKIVTHDQYSFYNPTQHPFFDQEGGRLIYFEGTYSNAFSGNPDKTPRYDYNQVMYRLALDDVRLSLPAPVYRLEERGGSASYALRAAVVANRKWNDVCGIPFFAVPPDRPAAELIPVFGDGSNTILSTTGIAGTAPLFYALPAVMARDEKPSPDAAPLYEFRDETGRMRWYALNADNLPTKATRSREPLCRVWRNPCRVMALDVEVQPVQP